MAFPPGLDLLAYDHDSIVYTGRYCGTSLVCLEYMALQKLTASLVAGSQETTIALANLNFDFSLFKVEAPPEFRPLGDELTAPRRNAAENGSPHVTARKLGALFQRLLPPTPELIRAYGHRVSEIASARAVNPKGTKADGVFADQVGVDGTSIWAAATSGPESIAVHLLACMLARIWTGPEATSIWVELVSDRKKELEKANESDLGYLSSLAASQINLSRIQLAEWDASARAWLRAADEGMLRKQKQLMLVLNNVHLPVNNKMSVYQSVVQAWISAMTAVDRLVQGMPQSIQDGAVLLGLSSWHLYPDMVVLGDASTEVQQTDPLFVTGGILTIGLELDVEEGNNGVFWSLPLAHLRYYSGPVMSVKSMSTDGTRVSVDQLLQVCIGCLVKAWNINMFEIARFLTLLWECICDKPQLRRVSNGFPHWIALLEYAVAPLFSTDTVTQRLSQQLIRLGAARCPDFMFPEFNPVKVLFGLTSLNTMLALLQNEEHQIETLRDIARHTTRHPDNVFVIRYTCSQLKKNEYEYATALPISRNSSKRKFEESQTGAAGHGRWVISQENKISSDYPQGKTIYNPLRQSAIQKLGEECFDADSQNICVLNQHSFVWKLAPKVLFDERDTMALQYLDFGDPFEVDQAAKMNSAGDIAFQYVAGDAENCALFMAQGSPPVQVQQDVSFDLISSKLQSKSFSSGPLLRHLSQFIDMPCYKEFRISTQALATVTDIYKMLPNATVALNVTSQPLYDMPWIPNQSHTAHGIHSSAFQGFTLDWASTFACIALFESGTIAAKPSSLQRVMAMSVEDSLYVAAPLLCDPSEMPQGHEVRRIRGNVGRPGIAMLIPPQNPRIRTYDLSAWKLINHTPFDGQLEDSFQATSLHLTFTDYVLPIDTNSHGGRDTEIYFLESLVSLHDRGIWVADLDILGMMGRFELWRVAVGRCSGPRKCGTSPVSVMGTSHLTMIDNWMELLDRLDKPSNATIFRSRGNWIGRLAGTALSLQGGCKTIVFPNEFCWSCLRTLWKDTSGLTRAVQEKVSKEDWRKYDIAMPQMAPMGDQNVNSAQRERHIPPASDEEVLDILSESHIVLVC